MSREAAPIAADAIAGLFEAIVSNVQARDRCHRVEAWRKAIDEHPGAVERYVAAVECRPVKIA
jgi:hypothetical protein